MKKSNLSGAVLLALSLVSSNAIHAMTFSLDPSTTNPTVGNGFEVKLDISGLLSPPSDPNEVLSAYGLDIKFDPTLITATGIVFGNLLGAGTGDSVTFSDWLSNPGLFTVNETSLLSDVALRALQADSFTLATLSFNALKTGAGDLSIQNLSLAGQTPSNSQTPTDLNTPLLLTVGANITNQPNLSIPEPTSLALISIGLFAGFFSKRKINQA